MSEAKPPDEFKFALSGDGVNVERRIPAALANRVLALVLGGGAAPEGASLVASSRTGAASAAGAGTEGSAKAFLSTKRPASDIEKIACLGFYLTHSRGIAQFRTKELTDLATEARTTPFSNATQSAKNAARAEYLASAGSRRWLLTSFGEEVIDALPDREKVGAVVKAKPRRRKRSGGKAKSK